MHHLTISTELLIFLSWLRLLSLVLLLLLLLTHTVCVCVLLLLLLVSPQAALISVSLS